MMAKGVGLSDSPVVDVCCTGVGVRDGVFAQIGVIYFIIYLFSFFLEVDDGVARSPCCLTDILTERLR